MSYCRFSCNDYQCDVYAYESEEGFVVHVAQRKVDFQEPLPDPVEFEPHFAHEWLERHNKVLELVGRSPRVQIDLPHAGQTFVEETPQALLVRLKLLRDIGYRIPDTAFLYVENEIWENEG